MEILIKNQLVLIDEEDVHLIDLYKWRISKKGSDTNYVISTCRKSGKPKCIRLHRLIMGVHDVHWRDSTVDHINGNSFDNRKSNLRIVTLSQNSWNSKKPKNNTSGYKGVDYISAEKKFRARISVKNKRISLGSFNTALEAAIAYDEGAKLHYGEYALLNFPKTKA